VLSRAECEYMLRERRRIGRASRCHFCGRAPFGSAQGKEALPFHPRRAFARSIVPPGLFNFRFPCPLRSSGEPALRFAAGQANYNRASLRSSGQAGADVLDAGGWMLERALGGSAHEKPSPREGGVSYIKGQKHDAT